MQNRQKGFSLIELLIVVAIILIIASIAIPSLLNARRSTNEAAVAESIRTINTAQISYNSAYPGIGFANSLAALGGTSCSPPSAGSACLIDSQLASGSKHGYLFLITGVTGAPNATYQLIANPAVANQTGVRSYCSFADGVIRAQVGVISNCDAGVPPLQ